VIVEKLLSFSVSSAYKERVYVFPAVSEDRDTKTLKEFETTAAAAFFVMKGLSMSLSSINHMDVKPCDDETVPVTDK